MDVDTPVSGLILIEYNKTEKYDADKDEGFDSLRTSKLKTPPICTKVPPFERARQGDSDSIKLISTKPNPAIQNASEILKTRLFTTLSINKSDPVDKFTRYAI
jgi:hypothetical protein